MKRTLIFVVLLAALAGGWVWLDRQPAAAGAVDSSAERKVLYYQSPMHPWIKSDKPGKCPICGMNMVPIYADATTGTGLTLNADSVEVAHIQTAPVTRQTISRTIRVAGRIRSESGSPGFRFTVYDHDLAWLKPGQTVELSSSSFPGKIFHAVIQPGDWTSPRANQLAASSGIVIGANLSGTATQDSPALEGAYAEGSIAVQTSESLAVPRRAVLAANGQPLVYVAVGNHYEPRQVTLGPVGDDFAAVVSGLHEGEWVVTSGNLTIDAEAQISRAAKP